MSLRMATHYHRYIHIKHYCPCAPTRIFAYFFFLSSLRASHISRGTSSNLHGKSKTVVYQSTYQQGDFCSGVFRRQKKDGPHRMISNLKNLNTYIEYNHFKMKSTQNVIQVIRPSAFIGSVDLKGPFIQSQSICEQRENL